MPLQPETLSVVTGILSFIVIGAFSSPAVVKILRQVTRPSQPICLDAATPAKTWYEDEDGEAIDGPRQTYSVVRQKIAIAVSSVTGQGLALGLAIVKSQTSQSPLVLPLLQVGIWVLLGIESAAFFVEASPVKRYNLGIYACWTSTFAIVVPCIQIGLFWDSGYSTKLEPVPTSLIVSIIASACVRGFCCILIPRRPNVYLEGHAVDEERSVSAYSRLTFSWVNPLLQYVGNNKSLDIDSLPKLPSLARAKILHAKLEETTWGSRQLWRALVRGNLRLLVLQVLLSLVTSVLGLGTQLVMYGILKSMEGPSRGGAMQTWLWVLGLGFVSILSLGLNSWLSWTTYSRLWIPTYEGLSALIFAKSMRCKEVKRIQHSKEQQTRNEEKSEEDDGDKEQKGHQSIINLATVDSKRISDLVTFANILSSCLMQLIIAGGFLVHLIGWRSLLAGVAVALPVTPVNPYLTKRYSAVQEEFMSTSDKRIAIVAEMLQGIRQIKFAALESQWQGRISEKRDIELRLLWKSLVYSTFIESVWMFGPVLFSAVSLTVYALDHGELPASVAFTALSVFRSLEYALGSLPDMLSRGMEAKVSADRIEKHLASAEKPAHTSSNVGQISFEHATVAWPAETSEPVSTHSVNQNRFTLGQLTLQFPRGGLTVITGKSGSGKSLLLASILGECDILCGHIAVPRPPSLKERFDHRATQRDWIIDTSIAYVGQNPWIENASIQENILFGLPYDGPRYHHVLFATGLEEDLAIFSDGYSTDIGSNGINLSGGQRWRVAFARALYSRAGILVMDDIFSALDTETGRHVYKHALTGELAHGRTRILVTHHLGLCLPWADYCVLLDNGLMMHAGTTKQLMFNQVLKDRLQDVAGSAYSGNERVVDDKTSRKRSSTAAASAASASPPLSITHISKKFTQDEMRQTGSVSLSVYKAYVTKGNGLPYWTVTFLAYGVFMALLVGRSWWLRLWTSSCNSSPDFGNSPLRHQPIQRIIKTSVDPDTIFYLSVYVGISVATCVVGVLKYLAISYSSLHTSRYMFRDLLTTILRAPVGWLDTVPLGRILNRFTSDIYLLDWRLGYDLGNFGYKAMELAGIMVAGVLVSPVLLGISGILLLVCLQLSRMYLASAREIKRLESIARSPVMEHFSSSLLGLATIRAFNKAEVYIQQMYTNIDRHAQASWHLWLFNHWLGFRVSMVGAVFTTATAALVVYVPSISPALAGFAISFALQYNSAVSMGVRSYANLEMDMNATERVLEYTALETEPQGGDEPPAAWPIRGLIEVVDLSVRYAPDLPPVLNSVSFTVEPNQRVGVVGRTGSGKSSLTLALFRFLEARGGHILIDGLDISQMKLQSLRSRIAIIPQDPVLFSGTVKSNLDPLGQYSDLELYYALDRVHLISPKDIPTLDSQASGDDPLSDSGNISSSAAGKGQPPSFFASLSSPISEGGLNLSQGQRQLLCLARAIASRPKITILDEATSAVDMETDVLVQRSIREEFSRNFSSLLVIAHRLSTIADFDKILVLDAGKAVEFGTPRELIAIEEGVFRNLVENSGEKWLIEEIILGNGR